jgi:type II secretory pathway pseudopilin PulG
MNAARGPGGDSHIPRTASLFDAAMCGGCGDGRGVERRVAGIPMMSEVGMKSCPGDQDGGGRVGIPNSEFRIPNSRQAGYTLVVLVMAIAVMAIMMSVALQTVQFQMQREREAELIFRGHQYVEAIRLYKQKYGRYPMRMKELWEANPRVLRQKWIDPITGSEEWGLVFLSQEGRQVGGPRARGRDRQPTPTPTPVFSRERHGGGERMGPIIGVHSLSTEQSIKVYEGRTKYDEWLFVLKDEGEGRRRPGGRPGNRPGGGRDDGGGSPWQQTPGGGSPGRPQPTGTPRN